MAEIRTLYVDRELLVMQTDVLFTLGRPDFGLDDGDQLLAVGRFLKEISSAVSPNGVLIEEYKAPPLANA